MIVKSRPMKKLCEYEGRPLPDDYKSDCWNDVDETEYACQVQNMIAQIFYDIRLLKEGRFYFN